MTDAVPVLAERRFEIADQQRFAQVSGDRNPMHMDPAFARRTQAGAAVVHGVHAVAWALDALARQGALPAPPFRLRVAFKSFLFVGDGAALVPRSNKRGEQVGYALESGGKALAQMDLLPPAAASAAPAVSAARAPIVSDLPRAGRLALAGDPALLGFDGLARAIGDAAVAELLLLSTMVGMDASGCIRSSRRSTSPSLAARVTRRSPGRCSITIAASPGSRWACGERASLARQSRSNGGRPWWGAIWRASPRWSADPNSPMCGRW